ncbi:MAG: M48 family metalloprotease [Oscillospiraceae bacterium]|jgi:heat shock protein HtpX|nr:M48 family metalloprotease [Oscillospiraceae bacterium]
MFSKLGFIITNHFLYVVVSLMYFVLGGFLLGGTVYSFIIAYVIYAVSVMIALSRAAEKLLRFFHGIRSIETNEEREYLIPIFHDVIDTIYQDKRKRIKERRRLELCIIDKLQVNACAIGRRTIAVTKGAMQTFDEEQLKGIIAHEIAHIKNGDTIAKMYLLVGSGYFYIAVSLFKLITLCMDRITQSIKSKSLGGVSCSIVRTVANIIVAVLSLFSQIALAMKSRKIEFKADETAYDWGLGENLISALYLLEKISLGDDRTVKQKLTASHPRVTARIGRLEGFGEDEAT